MLLHFLFVTKLFTFAYLGIYGEIAKYINMLVWIGENQFTHKAHLGSIGHIIS